MPRKSSTKMTGSITRKNKIIKKRKTRRLDCGSPLPLFKINGEYYLSCYDIKNHLSDMKDGQNEKYTFRKVRQTKILLIFLYLSHIYEKLEISKF